MFDRVQRIPISSWDHSQIKKTLKDWQGKCVSVLGDVGIDRYTMGLVERISPEAPVPVVLVEEEIHKLGLAANVADNVRALGGRANLVGVIGADRAAEDFRKILARDGLTDSFLVQDASRRTVLKERIVSDRQQLLRVDYESPGYVELGVQSGLLKNLSKSLESSDVLIVEDYAKGLLSENVLRECMSVAQSMKKPVLLDPNTKTPLSWYRQCSLMTPNKKEAETLSGVKIQSDRDLLLAGHKLMTETESEALVITLGKDGMAIFENGSCQVIPTVAREVYDVSGAGDTVISVLALGLASGAGLLSSAIIGNVAAGIEVGKRGTATVSVEEILADLKRIA